MMLQHTRSSRPAARAKRKKGAEARKSQWKADHRLTKTGVPPRSSSDASAVSKSIHVRIRLDVDSRVHFLGDGLRVCSSLVDKARAPCAGQVSKRRFFQFDRNRGFCRSNGGRALSRRQDHRRAKREVIVVTGRAEHPLQATTSATGCPGAHPHLPMKDVVAPGHRGRRRQAGFNKPPPRPPSFINRNLRRSKRRRSG